MIRKHNRNKKQAIKSKVMGRTYKNTGKYFIGVFKSNLYTNAYLVSPEGDVVKSFTSKKFEGKNKTEQAFNTGESVGKYIVDNKISNVYFNRSGYEYHGRVKALCDGVRKSGVKI